MRIYNQSITYEENVIETATQSLIDLALEDPIRTRDALRYSLMWNKNLTAVQTLNEVVALLDNNVGSIT